MPLESAPIPKVQEETEVEEEIALPWKVIVLNDPVNLMNYVVMVFRKVFMDEKPTILGLAIYS